MSMRKMYQFTKSLFKNPCRPNKHLQLEKGIQEDPREYADCPPFCISTIKG